MKNLKIILILLAIGGGMGGGTAKADIASESIVQDLIAAEEVKLENLGVENPGLLNTNFFYFVKKLKRSTLRTLSFDILKKIELELGILNNKAAELKNLHEIIPDNAKGLSSAIKLYQESIGRLQQYAGGIKKIDGNSLVSGIANTLIDLAVKHIELFDELKPAASRQFDEELKISQEKLSSLAPMALVKLGVVQNLKNKIWEILEGQPDGLLKEFRGAEALGRFEEKLLLDAGKEFDSQESQLQKEFLKVKNDLLLKSQVKIISRDVVRYLPELLEALPGDLLRRIKTLDEAREFIDNQDLKNSFNLARQKLFESAGKGIGRSEAENILSEANLVLGILENALLPNIKSSAVKNLFLQAEFNVKQAEEFLKEKQYGDVFSRASISLAAARGVLSQLAFFEDKSEELQLLKSAYDDLMDNAKKNGLTEKNAKEFYAFAAETENSLVKLSDLISRKNSQPDSVIPYLKASKLLLFSAEEMLQSLLNRVEEKIKERRATQPFIEKVLPMSGQKEKELKEEAIQKLNSGE
ncbi:MAG: hypothetical protein A3B92_00285 [Candidatus Harrisonbacteria bacterium RIFCSPHIGHO2_02_FULL_42_16]|uniref:DUF5667 domain-containing protein n=1 Tax=Candidatus Harrisonbacteria bacterium RIFCSPHIGHO2_02_FULL_42_16 TaxID=1798404 RepID=A0A1G1ZL59_9BACT|nr:MAG: hypothetical protein A3B92_00285 [Candidatus Harrisonbacteria bacterium RIFCSPHIGHO2_02_FULL_42_16]